MMTCGFIDMNTYILTEGNNFKTFLKELALDSYYVIEHEIGQVYGVCTHQIFLNSGEDLMSTLQFKHMDKFDSLLVFNVRFYFTYLWGRQISYKP